MESLSQIPLFRDVDAETLERQSLRCTWRTYEENELIMDYEDESRDVRFILDGKVRIILRIATGKEVILSEMRDGEFFGEIAAIDEEGRSANVTALHRTRICAMPQSVFTEMVEGQPTVNRKLLLILASRCRHLNSRLAEHCFLQTKHRLYTELLRQSRPRLGHEGQRSISPPPTQKDLASRIGTRREVVSREIASLKRNRIVDKTTGALVLCDLPKLNALISAGWAEAD
ncbi:MAG: Crp/Fnr family transcriptional regulator [Rhizobiaceae bacterium]